MPTTHAFPKEIPEDTREVVERLLKDSSLYGYLGEHAPEMLNEEMMQGWYSPEGRPGLPPLLMMLVSIFQYVEKLPDRQAAEMAVMRLDWKYALRQMLGWTVFHYSDLCNFRKRLLANQAEASVFEQVLKHLQTQGYVKAKGKQRTDATHVLGQVAWLSRLELVWETLRMALEGIVSRDARWVMQHLPPSFITEHSQKRYDYRLKPEAVKVAMQQAGEATAWLLQVVDAAQLSWADDEAIQVLRRVLDEQFERGTDGQLQTRPDKDACGDVLVSPHERSARFGRKGETNWQGYKLQVSESIEEQGGFITDVAVTTTLETDQQALVSIQARLAAHDLTPAQQYVDKGYVSTHNIVNSVAQGIDLRGRVGDDTSAHPPGFQQADFQFDFATRQATCPMEQRSISWREYSQVRNGVAAEVNFGKQCRTCSAFHAQACTTTPRGRRLYLNPHLPILLARRAEVLTEPFQRDMRLRQAIESTLSECIRAHGARYARYRGLSKVALQMFFMASALNLKRLAARPRLFVFLFIPTLFLLL
jgi:transposase